MKQKKWEDMTYEEKSLKLRLTAAKMLYKKGISCPITFKKSEMK